RHRAIASNYGHTGRVTGVPLPTKDGGTLRTVLDARAYMLGLSKGRERRTQWQHAAELLLAQADVADFSKQVELATSITPIVFAAAGDPVGTGLVASLARPGGNVTGLSIQQTDLAAKRLELLREVVPGLRRLAILANVGGPAVVLDMREVEATARTLGL